MRTTAALGGALLLLAACADKLPVDAADHHTALPKAPVFTAPVAAPPPTASAPADTCGAADLAYLVGKSRTEIPIPADLLHRRVVCTTCPLTPDVDPTRQTITYDTTTKLVTKVACG